MSILTALRAATLASLTVWGFGQSDSSRVAVRNLEQPGSLAIENHGPQLELAYRVLIERKRGTEWIKTPVTFELVEHCAEVPRTPPACLGLGSGVTLKPASWNGYSCSGQCPRSCRSNHYTGPGVFRFVVFSCDHSERFTGPEFSFPPEIQR
jgi:hypothetical protein